MDILGNHIFYDLINDQINFVFQKNNFLGQLISNEVSKDDNLKRNSFSVEKEQKNISFELTEYIFFIPIENKKTYLFTEQISYFFEKGLMNCKITYIKECI